MEMQNLQRKLNSVNGIASTVVKNSLGTVFHAQQVEQDHHTATVRKNIRKPLKVAAWNVRTLFEGGKLENVKQEMERLNINILAVCETRWTGSSDFLTG